MKRSYSSASSQASFVTADSEVGNKTKTPCHLESLNRGVSPPPARARKGPVHQTSVTTAAVEAGKVEVEDHVAFFAEKLLAARQPPVLGRPQIDHAEWLNLYTRSANDQGHHFVVHQHDHPVAGTHYDLRLQINATSSISFAIMYGLPGDPNSKRLNRNATETRVHSLWNHLIETASHETGTMLIWDTGEYEVLPYYEEEREQPASDSDSKSASPPRAIASAGDNFFSPSEPAKLAHSFSRRKIRLRLHGTRLPPNYTIGMRLTIDNDRATQPRAPAFKRKRKAAQPATKPATRQRRLSTPSATSSDEATANRNSTHHKFRRTVSTLQRTASPPRNVKHSNAPSSTVHPQPSTHSENPLPNTSNPRSQDEAKSEADTDSIRLTNAYPGATNSINSIHQRKWYLSLDRRRSGFTPIPTPADMNHHAKTYWVRGERKCEDGGQGGFERFHVLGRDGERSVVTGRLAGGVLRDEGVEGFVPRGRWRGVVE